MTPDSTSGILPTPATPGMRAVRRVMGAEEEILEGYGLCKLNEVIYVPTATADGLVSGGRFELAHNYAPPEE